jgi:hypothetical protein
MATEPWLERMDWASRRLEDENSSHAWGFFGFTLIWNLFSWGIAYLFLRQGDGEGIGRFLVLIFPGVGAILFASVIYILLRRQRYGVPIFELATLPAPVGRALAGVIRTRAVFDPAGGFTVKLQCIHRTVTGSGKNRSAHEDTVWEGSRTIPGSTREVGGIAIPIAIPIPPDARETERGTPSDQILWRLLVSAAVEGIDFRTQYEVPVYRTAESATPLTPEELARFAP